MSTGFWTFNLHFTARCLTTKPYRPIMVFQQDSLTFFRWCPLSVWRRTEQEGQFLSPVQDPKSKFCSRWAPPLPLISASWKRCKASRAVKVFSTCSWSVRALSAVDALIYHHLIRMTALLFAHNKTLLKNTNDTFHHTHIQQNTSGTMSKRTYRHPREKISATDPNALMWLVGRTLWTPMTQLTGSWLAV